MIVTAWIVDEIAEAVRQVSDYPRIGHGGRERNLSLPIDATTTIVPNGNSMHTDATSRATLDFWQRSKNAPWNSQRSLFVSNDAVKNATL